MKFSDFILVDSIRTHIDATDKPGVIRELVKSIQDTGEIPESEYESIVKAIMRREDLGSTGIGHGIAVPHTKHPSVSKLVGTIAISPEGIDFCSLDCEKVNLFFLLISPPDCPSEHLRALEHITLKLKDESFCKFLKQSRTKEDILQLLEEADNSNYGK